MQKQYTFFKSKTAISQLTLELHLALNFDLQHSPLLLDDELQWENILLIPVNSILNGLSSA